MPTDYRSEFADFESVAYLNAALQGPMPLAAAREAQAALEWKKRPDRLGDTAYFDLPDRIREKVSRVIGARPDEIAVTSGASAGLASVAAGIDWKPGDEVLVGRGEFPAHFSTWLRYEKAGKLRVRVVEPRGRFITADDYIAQIGPQTRVISASFVRFDNGARLDSARVGEACRKVGAALLLDITQCAGSMPLDIRELGADMAVCSGYKWLLGPYGAGFFWIASEWIERLPRDRCMLASPEERSKRGPYVCVSARKREETPVLYEKVRAAQIHVSLRDNALRIAPYLYNTPEEISRLIEVLSA